MFMEILQNVGVFLIGIVVSIFGVQGGALLGGGTGTLNQLDQWRATSTPDVAITQNVFGKSVKLSGLTPSRCLELDSSGIVTSSGAACGSGSGSDHAFPYTLAPEIGGVSTTTIQGFYGGFLSTASSTINSTFHLPTLASGGLGVDATGLVYSGATTTFSGGLLYTAGNVTDVLTAGDGLTRTTNDFDFDGGASPGGSLGGTWSSPTIDDLFLLNNADDATTGSLTATEFVANDTAATSTFLSATIGGGVFSLNNTEGIVRIEKLEIGPTVFDADAGILSWIDLAISTTPAAGTVQSYSAQIDGTSLLTVYGEANGSGALQNPGIGVGTTSPDAMLAVEGDSSGTILELAADTGVRFLKMLNTGATTLLGSWDFGGADFLEIPNGTAPVSNDPGELAHDTSDNMLILDDFVVGKATNKIWSGTVASTSPAFIDGGLLKIPTELDGYTMTALRCSVQGGTSKVIAVEDEATNSTEDVICAASVTSDDGSITNASVTAAEEMYIDFGATTGVVDYVSISVFGQWTRE